MPITPEEAQTHRQALISHDIGLNMIWVDNNLKTDRLSIVIPFSDLTCNDPTAFSMRLAKIYSDLGWNIDYKVREGYILFEFSKPDTSVGGCGCGSNRLMSVDAKITTASTFSIDTLKYTGYPPDDMGINRQRPNRLQFVYCLDCGKIQGDFPLLKTLIELGRER